MERKRISRRGITIQFHWIFILVAGGLILGFFFSVAQKQRAISQEKLSLTLASDIEGIFTGAILAKGTAQTLPVPSQGIGFHCSEGCECKFYIGSASRDFGDKIMFAPNFLEEQDLIVWAVDWKMPFRATNFLFITNPNVKYYIVYDSADSFSNSLKKELTELLPEMIDVSFLTLGEAAGVVHEGHAHSRFVFLNTNLVTLDDSFKKVEASAVKISGQAVYFYFKEKRGADFVMEGFPQSYAGIPSILAAMFSSNADMYSCGLKNAFKKLSYVSNLFIKRAEELDRLLADDIKKVCNYGPIISALTRQEELAKNLAFELELAKISELSGLMKTIENCNRDLVKQSCPELF